LPNFPEFVWVKVLAGSTGACLTRSVVSWCCFLAMPLCFGKGGCVWCLFKSKALAGSEGHAYSFFTRPLVDWFGF
jgi:hypothetical protein